MSSTYSTEDFTVAVSDAVWRVAMLKEHGPWETEWHDIAEDS